MTQLLLVLSLTAGQPVGPICEQPQVPLAPAACQERTAIVFESFAVVQGSGASLETLEAESPADAKLMQSLAMTISGIDFSPALLQRLNATELESRSGLRIRIGSPTQTRRAGDTLRRDPFGSDFDDWAHPTTGFGMRRHFAR